MAMRHLRSGHLGEANRVPGTRRSPYARAFVWSVPQLRAGMVFCPRLYDDANLIRWPRLRPFYEVLQGGGQRWDRPLAG